jgi:putative thioredoxin
VRLQRIDGANNAAHPNADRAARAPRYGFESTASNEAYSVSANATAPVTITAGNFMSDVVEASAQTPTLVDFWAPWCGPCKQLMPILDRLAAEYGGRFKLAKVNTDEERELAQQVGIRSLPTVVLFKDRTAVDHFIGLVPEARIREMLDKHLPPQSDGPAAHAQALKAAGDYAGAREILEAQLARDAANVALQAEVAELRALEGDLEGARNALEQLRAREPNHPSVKRLGALLEFSTTIAAYPDVRALRQRVADDPQDLEARHALAVHRLLGGDVEPAIETWLDFMRNHRSYQDDLGRRSLVLAFELIGEADPIVGRTRREMARLLF